MIPQVSLNEWRERVGWADLGDVEQDLIISRILIEIFSDQSISEKILFRGGTALNKLFMDTPSRYSEDIDLVHSVDEPIGGLMDKIRKRVDPILGKPTRSFNEQVVTLNYKFREEIFQRPRKIKIEVNNQEHKSFLPLIKRQFSVECEWFNGNTAIGTYQLEELLGTKVRALYQRKKGRDLFDLWIVNQRNKVDWQKVFESFRYYLSLQGTKISKTELKNNLHQKRIDQVFCNDIWKIISPDIQYNQDEAFEFFERIFSAL